MLRRLRNGRRHLGDDLLAGLRAPLDSQPEWGGVLECVNHFHLHLFTELLTRVHETAAVLPVNACR